MIWRRKRMLENLDRDFDDHIRREMQDNLDRGIPPDEAHGLALRKFGNVTRLKEDIRGVWSLIWLEQLSQDARYAIRTLQRNAGFSFVAILALALGIGVNTAVFTAYKAMVGRGLDAHDPGQMVNLALLRSSGATDFSFSYPDYKAYRDTVHSFSGLIAFSPEHMRLSGAGGIAGQIVSSNSSGSGRAEFVFVFAVSENYFKVLGVSPLRGRSFDSMRTSELAASPPALISENFWHKRFGSDPAVLGRTIRLNGTALTVVGITPHDFVGTSVTAPDFWLPLRLEPLVHADANWLRDRENRRYRLFGRLAPGITIGQAQAELTILADHLRTLHDPHADSAKPANALVWPGSPFPKPLHAYPGLRLAILLIMAATGMVLLVACANVASLQLARARSRQNELQTRLSLGASRPRVVRQLLTESALLGLLAGVIGLLSAWVLLRVAITLALAALPFDASSFVLDVSPNAEIFVFSFSISLLAGLLFGLAPALESSRDALFSGARGSTLSVRSRRLQNALVAGQVGLSLVLGICGSMFVHGAIHSIKMETGYDSKHVVDLSLQFPEGARYTTGHQLALVRELRRRLSALPGVAAITSARPPDDNLYQTAASAVDSEGLPSRKLRSLLHYAQIQSNYFGTLGIPLTAGRSFPFDRQPEHSVILSESAARQLWPGQNALGRSLRLGAVDEKFGDQLDLLIGGPAYQVIGIARDTRGVEFDGSDSNRVYLPLPEDQLPAHPILIRTQADPARVTKALDRLISSVDPELVATSATLDETLRQTAPFITSNVAAAVASSTGLLGLFLACIGIYGTVSFIVVLRTREIGIRMAIGARKRQILGLILRESARPVLAGLLTGMLLAVGASYLLRDLLYGLNIVDGFSFGGMSLLFFLIAMLAAYPPSRKAMRVDPVVALRYE